MLTRHQSKQAGVEIRRDIGSRYIKERKRQKRRSQDKPQSLRDLLLLGHQFEYFACILSHMPFDSLLALAGTNQFFRREVRIHVTASWHRVIGYWMRAAPFRELQWTTRAVAGGFPVTNFLTARPIGRSSFDIYIASIDADDWSEFLTEEGYSLTGVQGGAILEGSNLSGILHWSRPNSAAEEPDRVNIMMTESKNHFHSPLLSTFTTATTSYIGAHRIRIPYPQTMFANRAVVIARGRTQSSASLTPEEQEDVQAGMTAHLDRLTAEGFDVRSAFVWVKESCGEACGALVRRVANFDHGNGTSFALAERDDVVLERIVHPRRREMWWTLRGRCYNRSCFRYGVKL